MVVPAEWKPCWEFAHVARNDTTVQTTTEPNRNSDVRSLLATPAATGHTKEMSQITVGHGCVRFGSGSVAPCTELTGATVRKIEQDVREFHRQDPTSPKSNVLGIRTCRFPSNPSSNNHVSHPSCGAYNVQKAHRSKTISEPAGTAEPCGTSRQRPG